MLFIVFTITIVLFYLFIKRYYPVKNVSYESKVEEVQEVIVDIRDYN